jgi:hypothetical protein
MRPIALPIAEDGEARRRLTTVIAELFAPPTAEDAVVIARWRTLLKTLATPPNTLAPLDGELSQIL